MATGLFYAWLALCLLTFGAINWLLGAQRGWFPEKPMVPTDDTPDISRGELGALILVELVILTFGLPMFTANTLNKIDETVIFGSLSTLFLLIQGLLRLIRNKGKFRFAAPRTEYAKCLSLAFVLTAAILIVNWKWAKYPPQTVTAVLEEVYEGKSFGFRIALPVRSIFPWENPHLANCSLGRDKTRTLKPGVDKGRATFIEGGLGIPLLLSCDLD